MIRSREFEINFCRFRKAPEAEITWRHSNGAVTWIEYRLTTIGLDGVTGENFDNGN